MFMKTYTVTYGFDVGTRVHCTMVSSLLISLDDRWSHDSAQLAAETIADNLALDGYRGVYRLDDCSATESPGHSYVVHHKDGSFSVRVFDPRHGAELKAIEFAMRVAKHEVVGADGKVL